jgi:hypothetical protein
MPVTLSSFSLPDPATLTLPDGTKVELRPLSMVDDSAVSNAIPQVRAPMIKDPGKGSDAPKVADTEDPDYQRALVLRYTQIQLARLAVAMGYELEGVTPGGKTLVWSEVRDDPDRSAAWVRDVVEELTAVVTKTWYEAATKALESLELGAQIAERGEGFTGGASASPTPTPSTP